MKFAIAPVTYWDSIGFDTTEWRKSLDGTKAICHLEYAEKLGANLHANPQVQIIDSVDPNLKNILESSEWVIDGTNGDLDSFSFLTKLNQFETKVNDAVSQKTADLTAQLQQTANMMMAPYRNLGSVSPKISLPFSLNIVKSAGNHFSYRFNDSDFIPFTPSLTVWISPEGNDSTGDGTEAKPYKTVRKCLDLGDNILIRAKSGMYNRVSATTLQDNKTFKVVAEDETYFLPGDSVEIYTVTLIEGTTNVYFINRIPGSGGVFDINYKDEFGYTRHYETKTSLAEVDAVPGSACAYTHNGVSGTAIKTFDGRKPDKYVIVDFHYACLRITNNANCIIENVTFIGGMGVFVGKGNLLMKRCLIENTKTQNGFSVEGTNVVLIECEANSNTLDGFNYHNTNNTTITPFAVEINCSARRNGWRTTNLIGQNQGSTVHENYEVLRLNGVYQDNAGSNIADVNDHKTHLINCIVERPDDYLNRGLSVTNITYLDSCVVQGETALYLNTSTLYRRNTIIIGDTVGGTVVDY